MNTLKIKLNENIKNYFFTNKYYGMISIDQFLDYFLPNNSNINYIIVNNNDKSDITIYDIQLTDISILKDDKIMTAIMIMINEHINNKY